MAKQRRNRDFVSPIPPICQARHFETLSVNDQAKFQGISNLGLELSHIFPASEGISGNAVFHNRTGMLYCAAAPYPWKSAAQFNRPIGCRLPPMLHYQLTRRVRWSILLTGFPPS